MKTRARSVAVVISILCLMAGIIFTVRTVYDIELRNRKLVYYRHPVVVLKVDNRGEGPVTIDRLDMLDVTFV